MSGTQYKWGIVGPGFIAEKTYPDLARSRGAKVSAVASRTRGKAQSFADKRGIEKVYTDYEAIFCDPDVDIIYITTPNAFHEEPALQAMEHGKHVLCEKPFAMNVKQAKRMADCAKANGAFLMEAMWTRFIPAIRRVRDMIEEGVIGEVHQIVSDFSYDYPFDPSYHLYDPKAGGGTLLDGGIYPISFSGYLYGEAPDACTGYANLRNGVDVRDSVVLHYRNGGMASFICGGDTRSQWDSLVYGSRGCIRIPSFYAAKEFTVERYGDGDTPSSVTACRLDYEGLGYQFQFEEVMRCLDQSLLESPIMPLEDTIACMQVMDNLRHQWQVIYPGEQDM